MTTITEITVGVGRTINLTNTYEALRPSLSATVKLAKPQDIANEATIAREVEKVQALLERTLDAVATRQKEAHIRYRECAAGKPVAPQKSIDDIIDNF